MNSLTQYVVVLMFLQLYIVFSSLAREGSMFLFEYRIKVLKICMG